MSATEAKVTTRTATTMAARLRAAEAHLRLADPVMARLIAAHGPCRLGEARLPPFRRLALAIISQQLSTRAAATIAGRVRDSVGGALTPARILAAPPGALRAAGLSHAKARYLVELGRRVAARELDFAALSARSDAEVIEALTELPGVGRWTAEMFLIFGLQRLDVLSQGDAGLRRAARSLYPDDIFAELARRWQPYCSVACWYLWRHLEAQPPA